MDAELAWPANVPVLTDGVVTLRAHGRDDVDRMLEFVSDAQMTRWTTVPTPYRRADAEAFLRDDLPHGWDTDTNRCWAIEFEGRFVGNVDVRGAGPIGDIGFGLHPDARGRGVMRRAVVLALDHAFATGRQVMTWTCAAGNQDSLRVAHRCGFALHATLPDAVDIRGDICDAWSGSIRAGDRYAPKSVWRATTFETDRFRLRPTVEADDERIREMLDDPTTRRYLSERPSPLTLADARRERHRKWWRAARGEACSWAIADRADDRFLGDITLFAIDDVLAADVGFCTHPDSRRRGVLTEALPAVARHAFDVLDVGALALWTAQGNAGGNAVARSAGFRRIGHRTSAARSGDDVEDLIGYELLRG
ncbi:GNAT family N-acetyltransferase [Gordonia sp. CPCC 206044]|uniref:GNAT family N-acetyltransferase n=1 Tax=Gordonia sp. CPCC 206044 TaxID=3140793 RepID=UPI003AF38C4E